MFIKIWYFFTGYVRIEIAGFSVERFISQATAKGVVFWNMQRNGAKFVAYITKKDFAHSKEISQKTGTKVEAAAVFGLPYILARLKKRLFLFLGGLAFAASMLLLTSFVWRIDIIGTDRLDDGEIITFLEQNGLTFGSFRRNIAYRDIESALILEFLDIAHVSLNITGTRATISIAESILVAETLDTSLPADIVAAKDAVIVYMATTAGQPLLRPGDVVAAGEVIVAGELVLGSAEEGNLSHAHTHAVSEVWGRVYYAMHFEIPLTYFEKTFTNRVSRGYTIHVGNGSFNLPRIFGVSQDEFLYSVTTENRWQLGLGANLPLPFVRTTTTHYELVRHLRTRSTDAAKDLAIELANRRIDEELGINADIIDKQIIFTENERALMAEVFLIVIERIDLAKPIEMGTYDE
ncbi:MAG: sporulation protein YqfD [Defluviitaleaceae bacterium]|nr:sporulation protein YqfD [Defluviitaleaceae bacterium]